MAYTIDRYNNSQLTVVEDGTIDQTTDLKLVGKNYAGYGEIQNENFVFLLENFSGTSAPPKAISGQIWFDSSTKKLKFYDGTKFRTTGGAEVSATQPAGLTEGDFWWDTGNEQLYAFNGTTFVLVGPQDAGSLLTQWKSATINDNAGVTRSIIKAIINDEVVMIVSNQAFTIDSTDATNAIAGFDVVKQGMTLKNTVNATGGTTSTNFRYWGTASNADKLGGIDAANYLQAGDANFTALAEFADIGIAVGDSNDFRIKIENGNEAVLANEIGSLITIRAKDSGGSIKNTLKIQANSVIPGLAADGISTETVTLGTADHQFNNVFANNFTGLAEKATSLVVSGTNRAGSEAVANGTVATRTNASEVINAQTIPAGSLKANYFVGISTQAQYADLAEKYTTAEEHPVGTAMAICRHADHEADPASDIDMCIGVTSDSPALLMNANSEGQPIALKGRVPVRVIGLVEKGDPVYVGENGVCQSANSEGRDIVGIALESNDNENEKLVECVLKV
tara:strand:+ start:513 stop:2039 length:1527 start_codon:yes stop_codon:yes gene_type:complete